jgi:hypothetical protein
MPKDDETPMVPASVNISNDQSSLSLLSALRGGHAPTIGLIALGMMLLAGAGYVATHMRHVQHLAVVGQHYAMHHPGVDAVVATLGLLLVLASSQGFVR